MEMMEKPWIGAAILDGVSATSTIAATIDFQPTPAPEAVANAWAAVGAALYGSLHAVGDAENIPTSQSVPRQPVANLDPDS